MFRGLLTFVVTFFCTCDISLTQPTYAYSNFGGSYGYAPAEHHSLIGTKLHGFGSALNAMGDTTDAIIGQGKAIVSNHLYAMKNKFAGGGGGAVNANFGLNYQPAPVVTPYTVPAGALPAGYAFTTAGGTPLGYGPASGGGVAFTTVGALPAGYPAVGYVPTGGAGGGATFTAGGPAVGYVPTGGGGATFTAGGGPAIGYVPTGGAGATFTAGGGPAVGYVPTGGAGATFTAGGGPAVGYVPVSGVGGGATFTAGGGSAVGFGGGLMSTTSANVYYEYIDGATGARVRIPEALAYLIIHN